MIEQPTFEVGDRFLLQKAVYGMDCTREAEWWDNDSIFFDLFSAGLKGCVVARGIWEEDPDNPAESTLYFTLRFDACPQRKIMYIACKDYGGPFERVAAKAMNLN